MTVFHTKGRVIRYPAPVLDLVLHSYNMHLMFYVNKARFAKAVRSWRKKDESELTIDIIGSSNGMCCRMPSNLDYIFVGLFEPRLDVLAHELVHALELVSDFIGFTHGFDNSEPAAHLMAYMFRECYKAIEQ